MRHQEKTAFLFNTDSGLSESGCLRGKKARLRIRTNLTTRETADE